MKGREADSSGSWCRAG